MVDCFGVKTGADLRSRLPFLFPLPLGVTLEFLCRDFLVVEELMAIVWKRPGETGCESSHNRHFPHKGDLFGSLQFIRLMRLDCGKCEVRVMT